MEKLETYWRQAKIDRVLLLAVAAVIVGIAISIDGDIRRIVNGVGGIIWIVSAVRITARAIAVGVERMQFLLVLTTILALSILIRPTDIGWAAIGFGLGGVLVGGVGHERGSIKGALLAAWWLPAHLMIAVSRSILRELRDQPASLRGDPPPTAVLVPLVMVLAAWTLAALAANWRLSRDVDRYPAPRIPASPSQ